MECSGGDSNEDLVRKIAKGDQRAFQDLFDRLMLDVFRFSYSFVLDRQSAEDITQEAFVKLWQQASVWREESSIKTWLLTVARNLCLDALKKRKNDLKKHHGLYQHYIEQPIEKEQKIEHIIDYNKHNKILENAIFLLPERQREAVTLVYFSGIINIEAADIMGMKAVAFDSLLARARKNLRTNLGEDEDGVRGYFINKKD